MTRHDFGWVACFGVGSSSLALFLLLLLQMTSKSTTTDTDFPVKTFCSMLQEVWTQKLLHFFFLVSYTDDIASGGKGERPCTANLCVDSVSCRLFSADGMWSQKLFHFISSVLWSFFYSSSSSCSRSQRQDVGERERRRSAKIVFIPYLSAEKAFHSPRSLTNRHFGDLAKIGLSRDLFYKLVIVSHSFNKRVVSGSSGGRIYVCICVPLLRLQS